MSKIKTYFFMQFFKLFDLIVNEIFIGVDN